MSVAIWRVGWNQDAHQFCCYRFHDSVELIHYVETLFFPYSLQVYEDVLIRVPNILIIVEASTTIMQEIMKPL